MGLGAQCLGVVGFIGFVGLRVLEAFQGCLGNEG